MCYLGFMTDEFRVFRKSILWLKIYSLFVTVLLLGILFQLSDEPSEMSIEKINIVDPDGTIRLVLANSHQFPKVKLGGEEFERKKGLEPAGLVFYDTKGDECGGCLIAMERPSLASPSGQAMQP